MSVYEKTWFKAASWLLVGAYMGMIFMISHMPMIPIEPKFPHQDKVFHFFCYFGLAFAAAHAAAHGTMRRRFWLAFSLSALYGVSDEFHQSFVPGREASIGDWLADASGAWIGTYLFLKSEPVWRRSARPLLREEKQ